MSLEWWRSWHGAPDDSKWLVIARKANVLPGIVSAIAWKVFDYASQNDPRGSIEGFDVETYSCWSGFLQDDILTVIDAMREKGVISGDVVTNFVKRQPVREDDSRERTAKWRETKKSLEQSDASPINVTQCDAPDEIKSREDKDKDNHISKQAADRFSEIQLAIEKISGLPVAGGKAAIDAIQEIADMGAAPEDIQAAYTWYTKQAGNVYRFPASLVNPTRRAMAERIQKDNKWVAPPGKSKTPQRTRDKPGGGQERLPDGYKDWAEFDAERDRIRAQMAKQKGVINARPG